MNTAKVICLLLSMPSVDEHRCERKAAGDALTTLPGMAIITPVLLEQTGPPMSRLLATFGCSTSQRSSLVPVSLTPMCCAPDPTLQSRIATRVGIPHGLPPPCLGGPGCIPGSGLLRLPIHRRDIASLPPSLLQSAIASYFVLPWAEHPVSLAALAPCRRQSSSRTPSQRFTINSMGQFQPHKGLACA
ncbi:hypothetical protein LX36DRAFT_138437 [Colletotrichum falcatum]|nr:hypothetical protein LX36DRAFT_138437 [Colletotrichum falcatum]